MRDASYTYDDYEMAPDPSHRPMYLGGVLQALKALPTGAKVLDAGCGGGDFSVGLAEAGFRVFGCDMSPSGIAAAKARGIGQFAQGSIYDPLGSPSAWNVSTQSYVSM
jgi:2-polyprenyl-3-methyl-5-hydroxy-6-metoxy-1,4-benzoquinol methylase